MNDRFKIHFTKGFNQREFDKDYRLSTTIIYLENFSSKGYYIFIQYPSKTAKITGRINDLETELEFHSVSEYLYQAKVDVDLILSEQNPYTIIVVNGKQREVFNGEAIVEY